MDRLACINVPCLPLQLALRRFPPGYAKPLALIRDDRPSSPLLLLNRVAKDQGLRAGMRYSEALSIVAELTAVRVTPEDVASAREEIHDLLSRWSPGVEACAFDSGSFWLNAAGLSGLYGTEAEWGSGIRRALTQKRYRGIVVIGQTRGGTYVLAHSRRRSTVVLSQHAEDRALESAPLWLFPLSWRHRRILERLGVRTLSALSAIDAEELARRFGPELGRELRSLRTLNELPLQAVEVRPENLRHLRLEAAVTDRLALLPLLNRPLREVLASLQRQARLLAQWRLVFVLESQTLVCEVLQPAEPTTDAATLLRLAELRLTRCEFPTGVVEIRLAFHDVPLPPQSGELFARPAARDVRRGAEAVVLIRAKWGNNAVLRALPADSHIPELSFQWQDVDGFSPPLLQAAKTDFATAVRRIPLDPRRHDANPAGRRLGGVCLLRASSDGREIDKEYWFLQTSRGEVLWVSWDKLAKQARAEAVVD